MGLDFPTAVRSAVDQAAEWVKEATTANDLNSYTLGCVQLKQEEGKKIIENPGTGAMEKMEGGKGCTRREGGNCKNATLTQNEAECCALLFS